MAVVGAIAAVYAVTEQRKARKEGQRARAIEKKKAEAARLRQRQRALAEARKLRARQQAEAATAGVGAGSTVAAQATGAITSQLSSNLGFLNQMEQLESQSFAVAGRIESHQQKAQTAQAAGSVASSFG